MNLYQLGPVDGWMRVHRLPGKHFQEDCQATRIQAGGGSNHISETYHNDAKYSILPLDAPANTVRYREVMEISLLSFARQYFQDNFFTK